MVLVSGIAVVDIIGSGLERVARAGELAFCSVRTSLGGHACNVSGDLVRLGFPRSRLRVVFPAGRDLFGDFLVRGLRRQGLRVEPVFAEKTPTSIDLILIAKGEDRRYHADPGANVEMSAAPVIALLEKHRPLIYYAGGVGLLGRLDSSLAEVLRRAKGLGALTFVDVVSPFKKSWGFLRKALPWTDFFHCNADEAASLVGETEASKAAGMIRRLGAKAVFLTLGGEGVLASVPGALIRVPAFSVRVKDPTGAGDAFSAGLILKTYGAIKRGKPPDRFSPDDWLNILFYASACGAVCTTGIGTTAAVDAKKVEGLIRRQGGSLSRTVNVCPARPQPRG
ncbi:MAG: carbohydrate kinase family protein [Candidatus Aminicenantes bacterium]|nr:carbohydrate kinase family protein [Candidatus Aminicenantes bacterium]